MSDLQCAATLLVVRHAEAVSDGVGRVSDDDRPLTERGRSQAAQFARSLRQARVAMVYTSLLVRARQTGDVIGAELGLVPRLLPGVEEFSVGALAGLSTGPDEVRNVFARWVAGDLDAACPGAESGRDVLRRFESALSDVADLHRGETVVVVSHGGVMSFGLPKVSTNTRDDAAPPHRIPNCGVVSLAIDGDGWVLGRWPDSMPETV